MHRISTVAVLTLAVVSCCAADRPRHVSEILVDLKASLKEHGWKAGWSKHEHEIAAHIGEGNRHELRQLLDELPALCASEEAKAANVTVNPEGPHKMKRSALTLAAANLDGLEDVECTTPVFDNWGLTVKNHPAATCVPKNKYELQRIVQYAKAHGQRVRGAGYRHTWEPLFADDDEILVSFLPLDVAVELPAKLPAMDTANLLQGIELLSEHEDGAIVKVMAGTTNYHFLDWSRDNGYHYTLPFNVIMVEITIGGSFSMMCHGSALLENGSTLSDLVTEIEFVNADGEFQVVSDPELLKSAAGAMGQMGMIISLTIKVDKVTYVVQEPVKVDTRLAIPPPPGYTPPAAIWDQDTMPTEAELAQAQADFVYRINNHYYLEWFWFTMNKEVWVNTWANDGKKEDAEEYPGPLRGTLQEVAATLAEVANNYFVSLLPDRTQVSMLADLAMTLMPPSIVALNTGRVTTPINNAMHFRRGIQNTRVLDMEWEIPIPVDPATNTPDYAVCQTAWWDVIAATYEHYEQTDKIPMKLTLELRLMGGSSSTLAPETGNNLTCSIEILTTTTTPADQWLQFMQLVVDKWIALKDSRGNPVGNIRPHWAKQWSGLTVNGEPITDYLKATYAGAFGQFSSDMADIASAGGYSVDDMIDVFSNPLLRDLDILPGSRLPFSAGTYFITSKLSGKNVEVPGATTEEGAIIQQWPANGHPAQQWAFTPEGEEGWYRVTNVASGLVLDVAGKSTEHGGKLIQWPWNGGANQMWKVVQRNGYSALISRNSGMALDLWEWNLADAAPLKQARWWKGDPQLFSLTQVSRSLE